MNKPIPDHNDAYSGLREALRRDAAHLQDLPFDAALHHAAMRRIRALSAPAVTRACWRWAAPLAAGAAVVVIGFHASLWQPAPPAPSPGKARKITEISAPYASACTYCKVAVRDEDALLVMLDRDARTLLPPSPPVFSDLLN